MKHMLHEEVTYIPLNFSGITKTNSKRVFFFFRDLGGDGGGEERGKCYKETKSSFRKNQTQGFNLLETKL